MNISRSEFLRTLAVSAGAALAPETLRAAHRKSRMPDTPSRDMFDDTLNSSFTIRCKNEPLDVEARLIEITDKPAPETHEQFCLLFAGPAEPVLNQQTFAVEHDRLGNFDMFLVPVGQDDRGTLYEAVFNRTRAS